MDRNETIALLNRCEQARETAAQEACRAGKARVEIETVAREAATAIWNSWAHSLLEKQRELKQSDRWATSASRGDDVLPKTADTLDWLHAAAADFSGARFLTNEVAHKMPDSAGKQQTAEDIRIAGSVIDFSGFIFPGEADFSGARFLGLTSFSEAEFCSDASFREAHFFQNAAFDSVHFHGPARFKDVRFIGAALFENSGFDSSALFERSLFAAAAIFRKVTFEGAAWFWQARFENAASFERTRFCADARFEGSEFGRPARFSKTQFLGNIFFNRAMFRDRANFSLAVFDEVASFDGSRFCRTATFSAIRSVRAFAMADARFDVVPDFVQAHFEEAPRLDNVIVSSRLTREPNVPGAGYPLNTGSFIASLHWAYDDFRINWRQSWLIRWFTALYNRITHPNRDLPARWHALKRLAIQAHDQDREQEFFCREMRASRFANDWPLPVNFWQTRAWIGFFRFWFGLLYGLFSNFGRSIISPIFWWLAAVLVSAVFYLGENDTVTAQRTNLITQGTPWSIAYIRSSIDAWTDPTDCYQPIGEASGGGRISPDVVGLSTKLRNQTSAPTEALHLALSNAFLIANLGEHAATRTFGCLYGIELYAGGRPVPIVPPQVSAMAAIQKVFSAAMIFLFGLALRNMFKLK